MIKSIRMIDAYKAIDNILDYMEHCLTMEHPPSTIPIPFKLIRELHKSLEWEPNPKVEE